MLKRCILCMAAAFLVAAMLSWPAAATTYYVKVGGNDALDGMSLDTAWGSINNGDVLGKLNPGDVVRVQSGTYSAPAGSGFLFHNCGGIEGSPLLYTADGPVTINGSSSPGQNFDMFIRGLAWTTFNGFELAGGNAGIVVSSWEGPTGAWGASNVTVKNCVVHDILPVDGYADSFGIALSGYSTATFHNNVVCNVNPGNGNYVFDGFFVCWGSTASIYNNTVNNCPVGMGTASGAPGTFVANNNIVSNSSIVGLANRGGASITSDYNLLYNPGAVLGDYLGVGAGAHDKTGQDPKYIGGGDFHLQPTSPAIDAGIDVGLPYNGLAPDMGAFEIPEPASLFALLGGLLGIAGLRLRRRS
jgi:hypothetical protein